LKYLTTGRINSKRFQSRLGGAHFAFYPLGGITFVSIEKTATKPEKRSVSSFGAMKSVAIVQRLFRRMYRMVPLRKPPFLGWKKL